MQKKQLIIIFFMILNYQQQYIAAPVNVWSEIRVEGYDSPLLVDDNRQIRLHGEGPGTESVTVPENFDTDVEKYVAWKGMGYPVLVHCIKTLSGDEYDSACGIEYVKVVNNNDIYTQGQKIRNYIQHKELLRRPALPQPEEEIRPRRPIFSGGQQLRPASEFSTYADCYRACKASYPPGYVETMQYPTASQVRCHNHCKSLPDAPNHNW